MRMPSLPRTRAGRIALGAAALSLAAAAGGATGALATHPGEGRVVSVASPDGNPWNNGHPGQGRAVGVASTDGHGWGDGTGWGP